MHSNLFIHSFIKKTTFWAFPKSTALSYAKKGNEGAKDMISFLYTVTIQLSLLHDIVHYE